MPASPAERTPGRHRRRSAPVPAVTAAVAVVVAIGVAAAVPLLRSSDRTSPPAPAASADPTPAPAASAVPPAVRTSASRGRPPPPSSPRPSTAEPARKAGHGAYPGADDTGVPAGTSLRTVGELTVTKAGTVVEGVRAECIVVRAADVTVRRSLVRGGSCGSARQVEVGDGARNVLIEDVEIDGARVHARGAGLGGSHLVVRRSTLDMNRVPTGGMALALIGDFAPLDDILVEGNLFNGGGSYTIWGGDAAADKDPARKARDTRFLDNAFGRKYFPRCGNYGPVAGWDGTMPGNRWSGNHWLDNGRPIVP